MNKLLKKLLGLLFPGIDGENDDPDPVDNSDDLDPDDADDLDLPDDDIPDDPAPRASARRSDRDERLARLEAEVERRGRLAAEASSRQEPRVDPDFQREEERLRSADITDMERWQIESNRTLRSTRNEARQALMQAQDIADRTRFEAKYTSDPRRTKYAERVEEEINKARQNGQNPNREAVYYYMLGKDIADGKLKPKAKTSSSAGANVNRGRSPGVRSDTPARGAKTAGDKLRSRLENINI